MQRSFCYGGLCLDMEPYRKPDPGDIKIVLGAHGKYTKTPYDRVRYSARVISYPDLEGESILKYDKTHDITLIKLNAPVTFNKGVQPACLPKLGWTAEPGWHCYATGWGESREKALHYSSAIWAGHLTKQQIIRLHTIQRVILVKIAKSYRTYPTNALNAFLCVPLHIAANSLYIKFHVWYKRSSEFESIHETTNLVYNIKISNIPIDSKIIELPEPFVNPDSEVCIDGSGIDGNVGTAVCIFDKNNHLKSFSFKLSHYSSVFQAELAAINFEACWALEKGVKINIFKDNFSSPEVL
ncbi:hypothetical protein AVEN_26163-1 [Araneus ventricosus]|uniref:Peptidase S1 domain-containing protein n=1 Tax=Araneus ventricosus TaxID=182803 RepID=A0A4Y2EQP7_ARAVE|nr:hypothetical protein AVEN_26163-1 [Araneus ventricosus]